MTTEIESASPAELSRESVLAAVKEIVGEQMSIEPASIDEGAFLEADLGCDSLDITEIVMETEDHFDLTVPTETDDLPQKVSDIVDGVLRLADTGE